MILLWSSLSLKHLAGTIKAELVQTQPYVHLNTEVSFQSAEVFGGTSVKGVGGISQSISTASPVPIRPMRGLQS